MLPQAIFLYHAFVIVVLSLLVITRRNPVHSVLLMLVLFFHIASLYLFLNAEFMAAIQVLVYAGAILVLFLFVILLLNLRQDAVTMRFAGSWPSGILIAGLIFLCMFMSLKGVQPGPSSYYTIEYIKEVGHIKAVGAELYTKFIFPFEIASMILLVAIIGAVVLAKKHLT